MKRVSASVLCLIGILMPIGAKAANDADILDLGAVKCKEFLAADKDEIGFTIAWLDGYYRDEDTPAIIDFDKLKEEAAKLGSYCGAHPDLSIGAAAEDVLGK